MSTKDPTGFTYTDPAGRIITVLGEDPLLGPSHYLVRCDDGARGTRWWGVRTELIKALLPAQKENEAENLEVALC